MIKKLSFLISIAVLSACNSPEKPTEADEAAKVNENEASSDAIKLVHELEEVHQKELFRSFEVVQFDLNLTFGGKERFNGTMYTKTNGAKVKMEAAASVKYWDGEKVTVMPKEENNDKARFDLLTWSYFFLAPYKFSDPGTSLEHLGEIPLGESTFPANKLTFDEGVGDTPDDWYIIYQDKNSGLLAGMAYIVTSGETTVEEAEKDPHVITYEAYVDVEGIPFATQWNFWTWNEDGEMNKLLGSATISNVQFQKKAGGLFQLANSSEN